MMVREREKAWKALFQCESRLVGLERTRERRGLSGNIIGWCFRAYSMMSIFFFFFKKLRHWLMLGNAFGTVFLAACIVCRAHVRGGK